MRRTLIAHILLLGFGVHALASMTGGFAVICLGGGHEHGPAETEHCEAACDHSSAWSIPIPIDEHEDSCGCTDVEFEVSELPKFPRIDQGAPDSLAVATAPNWGVVVIEAGLGRRGPPVSHSWFDPAVEQRLQLVSSVRLII